MDNSYTDVDRLKVRSEAGVAVLELDSHPDHNKVHPKPILFIDLNHTLLHELCLEILCVHSNYLRLFVRVTDIATIGTNYNVFSYDAVWIEHQTHHLTDSELMRYVLCHRRGYTVE